MSGKRTLSDFNFGRRRTTLRASADCPVCHYRIALRADGTIGAHRVELHNRARLYRPSRGSDVGTTCHGTGRKP